MSIDMEKLTAPFPASALKSRDGGGGRSYTYVEAHTVIHRLNGACDSGWDWTINALEWRGELLICTGTLTIPGLGSRAGIGVQKVSERGGEDLIKGASSDALKKAATLFGVALELYGPDYEHSGNGYVEQAPQPQPSRAQTVTQPVTSEQPRSSNVHPDWKSHEWPEGKQLFAGRPVAMHARQNVEGRIVVTDTGVVKGDAITEPQGRRVYAMQKQYGYTDAIVHEMIAFCYGVNSTNLLTKREAGAVMDRMQYGSTTWSDPRQQELLLDPKPANTDTLAMLDEITAEQEAQDNLDAELEATLGYDDGPEGFTAPPYDRDQAERDYAAFSALLADVKGPAGKKTSQALGMVRDWMRENGYADNPRFQMALKTAIDRVNKGA